MTTKRMQPKNLSKNSSTRERPLEGGEAVELYAAEIARKIAEISAQADLLRAEIAESGQLLGEIVQDKNSSNPNYLKANN